MPTVDVLIDNDTIGKTSSGLVAISWKFYCYLLWVKFKLLIKNDNFNKAETFQKLATSPEELDSIVSQSMKI